MKRDMMVLCSFVVVLAAGGCQESQSRTQTVVSMSVLPPVSDTLTLSRDQLLSLDWDGRALSRPSVVAKRAVGGAAVDFDIRFPSNRLNDRSIEYLSTGSGGRGTLVGLDIQPYETLALKFTWVAIDGKPNANRPEQLVVGAVVGPTSDGRLSGYEPLVLSCAAPGNTGIARTPLAMTTVRRIGIHAHMADPDLWNPQGAVVTLRVEPVAAGTVQAASPAVEEKPRRGREPGNVPELGPFRTGAW